MAFDAFFLKAVLDELRQTALGGRVEKIHQIPLERLAEFTFDCTNELGMPHFTLPLNMKEAARFIGVGFSNLGILGILIQSVSLVNILLDVRRSKKQMAVTE